MPPALRLLIIPATALVLLAPGAAKADALDGEWCRDALSLTIQGPNILTPGGTRMTGDYRRHQFMYVIPPGEAEAGGRVEMTQLNDEEMDLRVTPSSASAAPGAWERWRRCKVTS
jgi:hypothetical protein